MNMHHLFFSQDVKENSVEFALTGNEFRHAMKVLRMKKGDTIHVTNGEGLIVQGIITSINKRDLIITIRQIKKMNPPEPAVYLGIGLIKHSHLELAIEKVTELGITGILPLETQYVVHRQFRERRLQEIIIAAVKQSLQAYKPFLYSPVNLTDIGDFIQDHQIDRIILFEKGGIPIREVPLWKSQRILYLIGPEGGFSEEEMHFLKSLNSVVCTLSANRLRSETAAISGLVKILSIFS
jgi:16S rRNA (uracil1498-N3)-methyltransferase